MGLRKPLELPSGLLPKQPPSGFANNPSDPVSYGFDYYNQRFEDIDQQRKPMKRYAKDTEEAIARMQYKWNE